MDLDFLSFIIGSAITVIMGGIGFFYQHWTAEADRQNQIRMAALDKRLSVHQEAYKLWHDLLWSHDNLDAAFTCQEWYPRNCLYLAPEARKAFYRAYRAAFDRPSLLSQQDVTLIKENWNDIRRAGSIIANGVGLPELGEEEEAVLPEHIA